MLFGSPVIPVTMNYGVEMNAWYNVTEMSEKGREDEEGISKSRALRKIRTVDDFPRSRSHQVSPPSDPAH